MPTETLTWKGKRGLLSKNAMFRIIFFAILWWILTGGVPESWLVGLPTVLISVFVSLALTDRPHSHLNKLAMIPFVGFFAKASVRGGIDVAMRAFHPLLPINPDLVEYPLKLANPSARILMTNIISLLPGTLGVELQDDKITVHVLDNNQAVWSELQAVESIIEALFRQN
jgi:multicomponent Na+:H+ antiporter subunit E